MRKRYSLFSLFSGAGGLDLGFLLTKKFEILFANDILSEATDTYGANFEAELVDRTPEIRELPVVFSGDVIDLALENFEGLDATVVAGGPPCQDFSVVRGPETERKGIEVSRGKLYSYFVKALAHLQPKIFLFENVPGLKSANEGRAYETMLGDFSNMRSRYWSEISHLVDNSSKVTPHDYEIVYKEIVNASKLGVPQARRRLIIIGVRKDLWWKVETLKKIVRSAIEDENKLVTKYPLTPLEVFEGKSLPDLKSRYSEIMKEYEGVADEVGTEKAIEWKKNVWEKLTFDVVDDYIELNGIEPTDEWEKEQAFNEHAKLLNELGFLSKNVSDLENEDGTNEKPKEKKEVLERMKRIPPDENHEFVRGTDWEVEGRGISLIYRRIHPLKPAYTVVAYGGGGTWGYHYERNRSKMTSRERARLQTFPDDFIFKGNLSQIRAQIGEAVPPLMAKRIAEAVIGALDELP